MRVEDRMRVVRIRGGGGGNCTRYAVATMKKAGKLLSRQEQSKGKKDGVATARDMRWLPWKKRESSCRDKSRAKARKMGWHLHEICGCYHE